MRLYRSLVLCSTVAVVGIGCSGGASSRGVGGDLKGDASVSESGGRPTIHQTDGAAAEGSTTINPGSCIPAGGLCHGGPGQCCSDMECNGVEFFGCMHMGLSTCDPAKVTGHCFPKGTAPCGRTEPMLLGGPLGCPSNIIATASSSATCCAPLGDQGAYACVEPSTAAEYCGICSIRRGSDYTDPAGVCASGHCPVTLATKQGQPGSVVVDATYAYWASVGLTQIMKVPLIGGTPTVLATDQTAYYPLVLHGSNLYWSSNGIVTMPTSGGTPTVLAAGTGYVTVIQVSDTAIYWMGTGPLMKLALGDGGAPETVSTIASSQWNSLVLSATAAFWTTDEGIYTVPLGGGSPTKFNAASSVAALAVDASNLYWAERSDTSCGNFYKMMRAPFDGSAAAMEVTQTRGDLSNLISDGSRLFWISDGNILAAPQGGGAPSLVAQSQPGYEVYSIAVDATSLYWYAWDTVAKLTPK